MIYHIKLETIKNKKSSWDWHSEEYNSIESAKEYAESSGSKHYKIYQTQVGPKTLILTKEAEPKKPVITAEPVAEIPEWNIDESLDSPADE